VFFFLSFVFYVSFVQHLVLPRPRFARVNMDSPSRAGLLDIGPGKPGLYVEWTAYGSALHLGSEPSAFAIHRYLSTHHRCLYEPFLAFLPLCCTNGIPCCKIASWFLL